VAGFGRAVAEQRDVASRRLISNHLDLRLDALVLGKRLLEPCPVLRDDLRAIAVDADPKRVPKRRRPCDAEAAVASESTDAYLETHGRDCSATFTTWSLLDRRRGSSTWPFDEPDPADGVRPRKGDRLLRRVEVPAATLARRFGSVVKRTTELERRHDRGQRRDGDYDGYGGDEHDGDQQHSA